MNRKTTVVFLILLVTLITSKLLHAELRLPSSADRRPNVSIDPFERARDAIKKLPSRAEPKPQAPPEEPAATEAVEEKKSSPFLEKPTEDAFDSQTNQDAEADENMAGESFTQEFSIVVDSINRISGGPPPQEDESQVGSSAIPGVISYAAELDTSAADLWSNGLFAFNAMLTFGTGEGSTSSDIIGDFHGVSGTDAGDNGFKIYQFYYQHTFPHSHSSFIAGIHDVNNDFYVAEYAGLFVNGTFGFGAAIGEAAGPSSYPSTSFGIRYKVELTPKSYFQVAAYDGEPGEVTELIDTSFDKNGGVFMITEVGLLNGEPGNNQGYYKVGVGGWYIDKDMNTFGLEDGEEGASSIPGTGGMYFLAETSIGKSVGLFLKAGRADGDSNRYSQFYAGGINYTGLIPRRDDDIIGFGIVHSRQSATFMDLGENRNTMFVGEFAYEFTYAAQIYDWLMVQPDFQYVLQPSMDPNNGNAVVLGIRLEAVY